VLPVTIFLERRIQVIQNLVIALFVGYLNTNFFSLKTCSLYEEDPSASAKYSVLDFYASCEQWRERLEDIKKAHDPKRSAKNKAAADSVQCEDKAQKQTGAETQGPTLSDLNPYIQNVIIVDGLEEVSNQRKGDNVERHGSVQSSNVGDLDRQDVAGSTSTARDVSETGDFRVSLQHMQELQLGILTHLTTELPSVAIGTLRSGKDGFKTAASIVVSSTPVLYLDVRRRPPVKLPVQDAASRAQLREPERLKIAEQILKEAKIYREVEWTAIKDSKRLDVLDTSRMAFWHMKWKEALSIVEKTSENKAMVLHQAIKLAEKDLPTKDSKVGLSEFSKALALTCVDIPHANLFATRRP
jgi:hypothetical protein